MSTTKQKQAARRNLGKARAAQSARAAGRRQLFDGGEAKKR
jgi:hypothetical protein